MKKRNQYLGVLLSTVMICSALAGCGSNESGSSTAQSDATPKSETSQETKQETTQASEEASEVLEVEMWTGDLAKEALMTEIINNYNATTGKEKGIELKMTCSSDIKTMLQLGLENGELPLLTDQRIRIPYDEGGWLAPFAMLPGGEDFLNEWKNAIGAEVYDTYQKVAFVPGSDQVYAIPNAKSGVGLIYNADKFVEAGIVDENGEAKPPTTWSEFLEDCKLLTTGNQYGVVLPMQFTWFVESVMRTAWNSQENYAVSIDWDNLQVVFDCEEPFKDIAEIYQNGYCVPGADTTDADQARAYFSEGVAAMIFGSSNDVGVFTDQYVADFNWDVCQLTAEDGTSYGGWLGTGTWYMPTIKALDLTEQDQEKLMSVIEWLYSDEVGVPIAEAGMQIPIKPSVWENADLTKLSKPGQSFVKQLENGRVDVKIEDIYQNVQYDNLQGVGLLCDSLLKYCKGELSYEDLKSTVEDKFTEALQRKVEEGVIDPAKYK